MVHKQHDLISKLKRLSGQVLKALGGIAIVFIILALIIPSPEESEQAAVEARPDAVPAHKVKVQAAASAKPKPAAKATLSVPEKQAEFFDALANARVALENVTNDMQKGPVRRNRKQALCRLLPNRSVKNWVGTVERLDSSDDGRGYLKVRLDGDTTLQTHSPWSDGLSDTPTMIPAGSTLFNTVAVMREGQKVRFSGVFQRDEDDCFAELSFTLEGSIEEPEFIFRFTDVSAM